MYNAQYDLWMFPLHTFIIIKDFHTTSLILIRFFAIYHQFFIQFSLYCCLIFLRLSSDSHSIKFLTAMRSCGPISVSFFFCHLPPCRMILCAQWKCVQDDPVCRMNLCAGWSLCRMNLCAFTSVQDESVFRMNLCAGWCLCRMNLCVFTSMQDEPLFRMRLCVGWTCVPNQSVCRMDLCAFTPVHDEPV